jgi:hypothetical protein
MGYTPEIKKFDAEVDSFLAAIIAVASSQSPVASG